MNKTIKTICAVGSTLLLCASFILTFIFSWIDGYVSTIMCVCGLFVGVVFAPIIHELGHIIFAHKANMKTVYAKAFCLRYEAKDGKKKLTLASPFEDDQTQVLPKSSGNMQQRAMQYTLGGLIFGGVGLCVLIVIAIIYLLFGNVNYFVLGIIPYMGYLEVLNLLPFEYASGKTDLLVYLGMKNGADTERVMLSAMEIQGKLYEGNSFCEMDENLFFNLPQLCEDEPLFAVILDLRYRYYLEKADVEHAADCLNRLVNAQAYLPQLEMTKLAAELVYMHAITGDAELAQESSKFCEEYLRSDNAAAKRALAAYSAVTGDSEAVSILVNQARKLLEQEEIAGLKKSEEILLQRIENLHANIV